MNWQETALAPKYIEGAADTDGDIRQTLQYFTYKTAAGLVSGVNFNVNFTIDRPAKEVWPYFKDFNLWQNSYSYYYSRVIGDMKTGETFSISTKPNEFPADQYKMLKVIPEHGMIFLMDMPDAMGGFEVFMLNEHEGKTVVNLLMQHDVPPKDGTEKEALEFWKKLTPEWVIFWRDVFIPNLKKLVYEGSIAVGIGK